MAAESPFSSLEQFHDDLLGIDQHQQQQRQASERRRDFATLVPFWFDEFQDFYHSDSEPSADAARPLPPHFSVDYGGFDDDGDCFSDASDLVDNVIVGGLWDADSVGEDDGGGGVLDDRENQVEFVRNLFQDRVENRERRSELVSEGLSRSDFGVVEESNYLDSDLGVELGLGFNFGVEEENSEFMAGDDCDDDGVFFGSWRIDGGESVRAFGGRLGSEEVEADGDPDGSELCSVEEDGFGLEYGNTVDDGSESLCWDSLQLEDPSQTEAGDDEELEWEEVVDGGVEELERDVFTMALGGEVVDVVESVLQLRNDEVMPERVVTGWEVLLNAENVVGGNLELGNEDLYFGPEGYFYADEYETVFGQFADNESGAMGKPPASKSSVENLETAVITQVQVESNASLCAVCKDDMHVGEKAKTLPCSHSYHGDCIIPWLAIRNTCPVCRFELPTDDPAYERRRTQRASI